MVDVSVEVTNVGGSSVSQRTFECESIVASIISCHAQSSANAALLFLVHVHGLSLCVCVCVQDLLLTAPSLETEVGEKDEYHRSQH